MSPEKKEKNFFSPLEKGEMCIAQRGCVVAVITPGLLPVPPVLGGGIETVVYDYAKQQKDLNIIIVSGLDGGLPEDEVDQFGIRHLRIRNKSYDNFEIVFNNEYLVRYNRYIYNACNKLKFLKPDVIHIHNMPHYVPIVRKILGDKVKIILTNHNEKISGEKYNRKKLPKIMEAVDAVIYPSSKVAQKDLLDEYPQYKHKVSVIYNGVDTDFFKKAALQEIERVKQKYKISAKKIVLFVGRLVAEKAVDKVLESFLEVVNEEKDAGLVIVGSSFFGKGKKTPYVKKLTELATSVKEQVIFTGFIDTADLPVLYSMADVFVSPVNWDDPSPKTIYEASACETPIISTKRGGIPEIVVDEDSALLLDSPYEIGELSETIIHLLREPDTARLLGQNARKRMIERFTVPIIAGQWEVAYRSVIK